MEARKDEDDLRNKVQIVYTSVTVRLRLSPSTSHQLMEALGKFNQEHREHISINMIGSLHPHPEEGFDDVVVEHALSDRDTFQTFLRLFCESEQLQLVPLEK